MRYELHQMNSNLQRTRVKICGITRLQDALDAIQLGVDALGLVFYDQSPRNISIKQAQIIIHQLPPFITIVGLFVNADSHWIKQVLAQVPLELLQFHGEETPEYCANFDRPYIKALRMQENTDIVQFIQNYHQARAILLDTYVAGVQGGTGIAFDWQKIPTSLSKPIILAGGLTPENVQQAIAIAHPFAVDVSGGVESSKGVKDKAKMFAFMQGVRCD